MSTDLEVLSEALFIIESLNSFESIIACAVFSPNRRVNSPAHRRCLYASAGPFSLPGSCEAIASSSAGKAPISSRNFYDIFFIMMYDSFIGSQICRILRDILLPRGQI